MSKAITKKELLKKAGKMSKAARRIVGGQGLNFKIPAVSITQLSEAAEQLKKATDDYDKAVLQRTKEKESCYWPVMDKKIKVIP